MVSARIPLVARRISSTSRRLNKLATGGARKGEVLTVESSNSCEIGFVLLVHELVVGSLSVPGYIVLISSRLDVDAITHDRRSGISTWQVLRVVLRGVSWSQDLGGSIHVLIALCRSCRCTHHGQS
jgi:hypothetical protein